MSNNIVKVKEVHKVKEVSNKPDSSAERVKDLDDTAKRFRYNTYYSYPVQGGRWWKYQVNSIIMYKEYKDFIKMYILNIAWRWCVMLWDIRHLGLSPTEPQIVYHLLLPPWLDITFNTCVMLWEIRQLGLSLMELQNSVPLCFPVLTQYHSGLRDTL